MLAKVIDKQWSLFLEFVLKNSSLNVFFLLKTLSLFSVNFGDSFTFIVILEVFLNLVYTLIMIIIFWGAGQYFRKRLASWQSLTDL